MNIIKFSDKKQEILDVLNKKHTNKGIPVSHIPRILTQPQSPIKCSSCGNSQLTLVDGFVSQPLMSELSGSFVLGGPTIPMVATVCNNCGHLSYYALKVLLPNIEL